MTATRGLRNDQMHKRSSLIGLALSRGPLIIPTVTTLRTLAEVRELVEKHLPAHCRDKVTWRHVSENLTAAAKGGDLLDVSIALRMAFAMQGVECRPK